ncbi:transposase family protein [Dactylosporangium sp. NPDC051484]|uniref:transposase family protein n=1 Tax=Dactylosporangium sp. NPDC051484 TaxID=3154942 RepID=UPI00344B4837
MLVDEIVDQGEVVRIRARTRSRWMACPDCGRRTRRAHAYHVRRLADLPIGGRGVVLELRVRRLACRNSACARRTFREQVPRLAARWARRTLRSTSLIAGIGVSVAGRAGAALLSRFGTRVSRSTVLRQADQTPEPGDPLQAAFDDVPIPAEPGRWGACRGARGDR